MRDALCGNVYPQVAGLFGLLFIWSFLVWCTFNIVSGFLDQRDMCAEI